MPPQRQPKPRLDEADVIMASSAIDRGQFTSNRAAAKQYNVNKNTLRNRRAGKPSRQDCVPNSKLLTELEEKAIIEYTLNVNSRSFQLNYDLLYSIINKLLDDRGSRYVGVNQLVTFIKRIPELKLRVNRRYNYQRALNENPQVIKNQFRLVTNIKAKYGIINEDIYNFDKVGF